MKAIPCELWIGTKTGAFFKLGEFDSMMKARLYVKDCVTCYSEIRKINTSLTLT